MQTTIAVVTASETAGRRTPSAYVVRLASSTCAFK
jgi:hypothetical protein